MHIGLVADTHDAFCDWAPVRARIAGALAGVDLVLHCGDITTNPGSPSLSEAPSVAIVHLDEGAAPVAEIVLL